MSNTSATGGPLLPSPAPAPQPLEGDALVDFFQGWIAGIVGLPGNMVRPRWQPEPANIPVFGSDWAAIGITDFDPETFAWEGHYCDNDVGGPGHDALVYQEVLTILTSFYGPSASANASLLYAGLQVAQNREPLQLANMGYVSAGASVTVPELVKERWLMRVDLPVRVRRQVVRDYPVLNLLQAPVQLDAEGAEVISENFIVPQTLP